MEITIAPNKIHESAQSLSFRGRNIYTLIGENGSGKSAILETAFRTLLDRDDINLISFTSGQNECYSFLFRQFLNQSRRYLIENYQSGGNSISSFHFDTSWVRLLIFFATTLKKDGLVRKFLLNKELINLSEDGFEDDVSTKLSFRMRVFKRYIDRLAYDDEQVSKDYEYQSKAIRFSIIHEMLEKLITFFNPNYDFSESYVLKWHGLMPKNAFDTLGKDVNQIFTFLGYATNHSFFIDRDDCYVTFKGGLELNDLSDGEFQLLSIYSILDLFDSENAVFLFDEIDSHLHYKNNSVLWATLKGCTGKVLTTTHSADSIILNDPASIKLVSKGKIEAFATPDQIFKRFENLTQHKEFFYRYASKLPYFALVENFSDWYIFRELAKRKIAGYDNRLEAVYPIARGSSANKRGTDFGKSKLIWIEKMIALADEVSTKGAFLLCDKDDFLIGNIRPDLTVPIADQNIKKLGSGNNNRCFLLCWRRREIENYFLCHTVLDRHGLLENIRNDIRPRDIPIAGIACDNQSIQELDIKSLIKPLYLKDDLKILEDDTGIDYSKLDRLIALIPPEEISEDIENMYNFILSKMD